MDRQTMERKAAHRDRQDNTSVHSSGVCGPMASLCAGCQADHDAYLATWANDNATVSPLPYETPGDYWRRIDGPFLDGWYLASCNAMRANA